MVRSKHVGMHSLTYFLTYLLTPRSRVLLVKLICSQLINKFPHFIELGISQPHSQVPATCPYPEPHRSSPCPLPDDPPIYASVFQVVSFPQVFAPKPCIPTTCPAHSILLDLITRTIFVRSTDN